MVYLVGDECGASSVAKLPSIQGLESPPGQWGLSGGLVLPDDWRDRTGAYSNGHPAWRLTPTFIRTRRTLHHTGRITRHWTYHKRSFFRDETTEWARCDAANP